MKCQRFYINNTVKCFFYCFCCFLIFLLCLIYSSMLMAQYYNWDNTNNFGYLGGLYGNGLYPWSSNFSELMEPTSPHAQGRGGFQSQAPEGIQVLSARNIHMFYTFWSRPAQYRSQQYQDPFQPGSYQPEGLSQNPPFYSQPYWHPSADIGSIGPSPFYDEPYYLSPFAGSGSIGPSPFYGKPYGMPNLAIGPSPFYAKSYLHPTQKLYW